MITSPEIIYSAFFSVILTPALLPWLLYWQLKLSHQFYTYKYELGANTLDICVK